MSSVFPMFLILNIVGAFIYQPFFKKDHSLPDGFLQALVLTDRHGATESSYGFFFPSSLN